MSKCNYTMPPRSGRKWMIVLPIVGAVAGFYIFALHHARSTGPGIVHRHAVEYRPAAPRPPLPEFAGPSADGKLAAEPFDATETFLADVYPSRQSATRALGGVLGETIRQVCDEPQKIQLVGTDSGADISVLVSAVNRSFPNATVLVGQESDSGSLDPGQVIVRMSANSPDDESTGNPRGSVEVSVAGSKQVKVLSTAFANREWVDDLTGYSNLNPDATWIVGRTSRSAANRFEAEKLAEEDAAGKLREMIIEKNQQPGHRFDPRIADRVLGDLRLGVPVRDRFVQQIHRPYGDIWSESVLLEVKPELMNNLSARYQNEIFQHDGRVRTTVASVAIVLVTIFFAYLLLNTITLRYFTGRLRAAAIFFALAAIVIAGAILVG